MANDYRDLDVWQLADDLRKEVIRLTATGTASRDFDLRDQLREAVSKVPANIAEGFRRVGATEFARFARYSFSGMAEAEDRLRDGMLRGHWSPAELAKAFSLIRRLSAGLTRLLHYLQTAEARERSKAILEGKSPKPSAKKQGITK